MISSKIRVLAWTAVLVVVQGSWAEEPDAVIQTLEFAEVPAYHCTPVRESKKRWDYSLKDVPYCVRRTTHLLHPDCGHCEGPLFRQALLKRPVEGEGRDKCAVEKKIVEWIPYLVTRDVKTRAMVSRELLVGYLHPAVAEGKAPPAVTILSMPGMTPIPLPGTTAAKATPAKLERK